MSSDAARGSLRHIPSSDDRVDQSVQNDFRRWGIDKLKTLRKEPKNRLLTRAAHWPSFSATFSRRSVPPQVLAQPPPPRLGAFETPRTSPTQRPPAARHRAPASTDPVPHPFQSTRNPPS